MSYDIDVISDRAESPQSRMCDHFRRYKNKYSGVSGIVLDCCRLDNVSCLVARKPCLNTVGDHETTSATGASKNKLLGALRRQCP